MEWLYLTVVLLAGNTWPASCSQHVPFLLWSNEGSLWNSVSEPHEGHVTTDSLLRVFLDTALKNGPRNVLLFLQEKLSIEDFTAYGGVYGNKQDNAFPNLENALETSPSTLVLPSVDWYAVSTLPTYLKEKLGASPLHVDPSTLQELKLNKSIPSLLVVNLPYGASSVLMTTKEVMRGNDEVLGQVLNTMKSEDISYIALLTTMRPSRVARDVSFEVDRVGRQLLHTSVTYAPLVFNGSAGPCIMLWAKNISVYFGDKWQELTNETFSSSSPIGKETFCDSENISLVLHYGNASGSPVTLKFFLRNREYVASGQKWFSLHEVQMMNSTDTLSFNVSHISAPTIYSYHCGFVSSSPHFGGQLLGNRNKSTEKWEIVLEDFQIQAFNVTGMSFNYASDCAAFFSPAIWMGLVTTFLLVFILTYGMHMVMSLKTMDRFDDPKGPSISVPLTE
ncbi:V-type proton ATPase subunit S1 [Ambystoma mexicanum]|uniref:V-type proton ATPase subunit S1 n=1 Tax=Ambystoma mexicanum TaxID=8296 RepID=UPI0037E8D281